MTQGTRQARFLYELKPGETWKIYNEFLIVAHPDRPPKIVYDDGREEQISPIRFDGEQRK